MSSIITLSFLVLLDTQEGIQQGRPLRIERLCVSLGKLMRVTIQLIVQEEKKTFIFKMFSYVYEEK